jgi:hypothetical protein
MPRYKFTYSVETPMRATEDVTFTYRNFTVTLGLSRQIDQYHIPASAIVEANNWTEANDIAMEDAFGPLLDALSLHRKAPAMLKQLQSVVKAEEGLTRRAVVIVSNTEFHPVRLDGVVIEEVQNALNRDQVDKPFLRWLRYSYRSVPVLETFVLAWLAFENFCGTKRVDPNCPNCGKALPPFSSTDREKAFQTLKAREPQLTQEGFNTAHREWRGELRNPTLHGGRTLRSESRRKMQTAMQRFRPAIEDIAQAELGYRLAYPGTRVNDGVSQVDLHRFIQFQCAPGSGEFADLPELPGARGQNEDAGDPPGVILLRGEDFNAW